jgi:hypothetical protein
MSAPTGMLPVRHTVEPSFKPLYLNPGGQEKR